ncbi:MAG: glycosyltransferase [Gammaproteobacteria bacterium]|nr:glycosyltransferase [Gammaproteobacteria bacterium]
MKFLYLTCTRFVTAPWRDASTRYRCFNYAEDLKALGYSVDVALLDELDPRTLIDYSVVTILRPTQSRQLNTVLAKCRNHGIVTIADFDDLLFSPEYAQQAPAVVNGQSTANHLEQKFSRHLQALTQFDLVTTATERLRQHVCRYMPQTCVRTLPNGLSHYWLNANAHVRRKNTGNSFNKLNRITYLPGSRSHTADFKLVAESLADLINYNQDLRLCIVGNLDFDQSRFNPEQLELHPWVDYNWLPALTAQSLVSIAPLCATEFNACKSHIKFIESAAFGTPVISSPNPDIEKHLPCTGLAIAQEPDTWVETLNQMLHPDYREQSSDQIQSYVHSHCLNEAGTQLLLDFLGSQMEVTQHERPAA